MSLSLRSPRSLPPILSGENHESLVSAAEADVALLAGMEPSAFVATSLAKCGGQENLLHSVTSHLKKAVDYLKTNDPDSTDKAINAAKISMQCDLINVFIETNAHFFFSSDMNPNGESEIKQLVIKYSSDPIQTGNAAGPDSKENECFKSMRSAIYNSTGNNLAFIPIFKSTNKNIPIGVITASSKLKAFNSLDIIILEDLSRKISVLPSDGMATVDHRAFETSTHKCDLKLINKLVGCLNEKLAISTIISDPLTDNVDINQELIASVEDKIFDRSFNSLDYSDRGNLVGFAAYIFLNSGLIDYASLQVEVSDLLGYINLVSLSYKDNPFHNLQHGLAVLQVTQRMLVDTGAKDFLPPLTLFSVMISSYVHDVGHPGNTNAFEINTSSELSILYNDTSCLENYHLFLANQLMRTNKSNILKNFSRAQVNDFRKSMTQMILSTDMAVHAQLVDDLKNRSSDKHERLSDVNEQLFFCKIIIHSADLANPTRPFEISKRWSELVSAEFNLQVEREKSLGLPFMPFMVTPDLKTLCKNEIGFASFAVAPLWKGLANWFLVLSPMYSYILSNVDQWKVLLEKETSAP